VFMDHGGNGGVWSRLPPLLEILENRIPCRGSAVEFELSDNMYSFVPATVLYVESSALLGLDSNQK